MLDAKQEAERQRLLGCGVYVGRKACGCAVAAVVDDPRFAKDTAKAVADFIKSGYAVERHPPGMRVEINYCKCPKPNVTQDLFSLPSIRGDNA